MLKDKSADPRLTFDFRLRMQVRKTVQLQPLGLFEYAEAGIVDFFAVQADDSNGVLNLFD